MIITEPGKEIRALFFGMKDGVLRAALNGKGKIFADNAENPCSAAAIIGGYCFFAGRPDILIASYIPADREVTVEASTEWYNMLRELFDGRTKPFVRYETKKISWFNVKRLMKEVKKLPDGLEIFEIGEKEFSALKTSDFAGSALELFENIEEFKKSSFGFAVKSEKTAVAAAVCLASFDGGAVLCPLANKGFEEALPAVSALFIMDCIRRGLYPYFTADDKEQLKLAQSLGYVYRTAKVCYRIYPEI